MFFTHLFASATAPAELGCDLAVNVDDAADGAAKAQELPSKLPRHVAVRAGRRRACLGACCQGCTWV
jgi:hypothetical protein